MAFLAVGCDDPPFGGTTRTAPEGDLAFQRVYDLSAYGTGGKSYGSIRLTSDGRDAEICWALAVETLPKAVQLHMDITGPTDPVVRPLYEPPGPRPRRGCRSLPMEVANDVEQTPQEFYLDAHNSDGDPAPVIWATLEEAVGASPWHDE